MSDSAEALKSANFEPQLVRSNLLLNADRYVLEQQVMTQLEAGAGPLGLMMVDLSQRKREICSIEQGKVPNHKEMLDKLASDGVYVNDPEVN